MTTTSNPRHGQTPSLSSTAQPPTTTTTTTTTTTSTTTTTTTTTPPSTATTRATTTGATPAGRRLVFQHRLNVSFSVDGATLVCAEERVPITTPAPTTTQAPTVVRNVLIALAPFLRDADDLSSIEAQVHQA